jgi:fumarylacetoacetase
MASWIEYSANTDFPIQNLPYGIFHLKNESPSAARAGVAIGDWILDLSLLQKFGLLPGESDCFSKVQIYYIKYQLRSGSGLQSNPKIFFNFLPSLF